MKNRIGKMSKSRYPFVFIHYRPLKLRQVLWIYIFILKTLTTHWNSKSVLYTRTRWFFESAITTWPLSSQHKPDGRLNSWISPSPSCPRTNFTWNMPNCFQLESIEFHEKTKILKIQTIVKLPSIFMMRWFSKSVTKISPSGVKQIPLGVMWLFKWRS